VTPCYLASDLTIPFLSFPVSQLRVLVSIGDCATFFLDCRPVQERIFPFSPSLSASFFFKADGRPFIDTFLCLPSFPVIGRTKYFTTLGPPHVDLPLSGLAIRTHRVFVSFLLDNEEAVVIFPAIPLPLFVPSSSSAISPPFSSLRGTSFVSIGRI